MEKIHGRIVNAEVSNFKNNKTGEITVMTKITYTYPREVSDEVLGPNILTCYRPGNVLSKIKPYVDTKDMSVIEIDERFDSQKNVFKKVIKKINNIEV